MSRRRRHDEPMVRTTLYLPASLYQKFRIAVIERGEGSATSVIERLVTEFLARKAGVNGRQTKRRGTKAG